MSTKHDVLVPNASLIHITSMHRMNRLSSELQNNWQYLDDDNGSIFSIVINVTKVMKSDAIRLIDSGEKIDIGKDYISLDQIFKLCTSEVRATCRKLIEAKTIS